jgi:hypothetical protein
MSENPRLTDSRHRQRVARYYLGRSSNKSAGQEIRLARLEMLVGPLRFICRWEEANAPKTVAAIRRHLPLEAAAIQARWSGESAWAPISDYDIRVEYENHTSHPAPGDLLLYPGGISEREILLPYGSAMFASKVGQLAGNHFATIVEGRDQLVEMGRLVLWHGAQKLIFREID